ncbi:MAG: peptidoglycan recognition family protein [Paracoccus sp. (in: a-proteobacteria)]
MRRRSLILAPLALAGAGAVWAVSPLRFNRIVIHHSGGGSGDPEMLIRVHRERQPRDPIDMIPYHFVIGNGRGMGDGEVHATARWRWRLWGAHLSGRNTALNVSSVGICLIGNFETAHVSPDQFDALTALCRELMKDYGIGREDIGFHGDTPGEATACPGRNFPRSALLKAV